MQQPATPLNLSAARRLAQLPISTRRTAEEASALRAAAAAREAQRVDALVLGRKPAPPAPVKLPPKPAGMNKQAWKVERQRLRDAAAASAKAAHPYADQIAMREAVGAEAHGTPQTLDKAKHASPNALRQMHVAGAISDEQWKAAEQIAAVAERIVADVTIGTASLEARVDTSRHGDGGFYERLAMVRMEVAYTRWRARIPHPAGAVLDMLVGEPVGFTTVAKRYRMHHRRARRLLIAALELWPEILAECCREIDQAKLTFIHSALA